MCLDRVWGNLSLRCSLFFCKNQSVSSQVHFTVWLAIHACLCLFCFHSFCWCCWYFVCSVCRSTLVSQFHNSILVKSFRAMALYFPIWNSISYRLFSSLWKSFPSMWCWNDLAKCYFNVKWSFLFCDFPVCLFFHHLRFDFWQCKISLYCNCAFVSTWFLFRPTKEWKFDID